MVSQATQKLYINTGNLTEWNRLKGKFSQSSKSELQKCVDGTLTAWKESVDIQSLKDQEILTCRHEQFPSKISSDSLNDFEISAKIFALSGKSFDVKDALEQVIQELGITKVDNATLSLPPSVTDFSSDVQDIWQMMEQFVDNGHIQEIGICDFDLNQLSQLHDWSKIKPATNSVNLSTCCVIPPELVLYAKENNVRLLTHADLRDILDADYVKTTLNNYFSSENDNWQPIWVARYTALIKHRGIIKSKGYILRCDRIED
ncbi:uncharacterized protein TRIADDRAFT_63651 [Trichoplax adhaerens]|uniref:GCS light chain n=1 Tax=Trichoplax adhaerens TaxID=10228 RepID=B3RP58_TRIAD|nr:hypothetical protein TRIADDRAFT_63651 [Trichoplax adhaerens]EDV28135.1 hypothetical protein TRIADDRAFT_63651 [Trichoplax adhaerens]|eukprot:XP_002109969.1 hypothetical protein TRIADDRAFT_63651 [Trichoplax adhaerens]